jgi:hypothetical protein
MANHAVPVVVNNVVLCGASRWESRCERCASRCVPLWAMLRQWLYITICYTKPVVLNHCELCWASGCETLWVKLRYCCESLWVMLSQWLWIIVCYAEPDVWESWCVMLSQWLWIIVLCWAGCLGINMCYSEPVVGNHGVNPMPVGVNHDAFCWASGCESLWVTMCQ